jgi:hypothetical protein
MALAKFASKTKLVIWLTREFSPHWKRASSRWLVTPTSESASASPVRNSSKNGSASNAWSMTFINFTCACLALRLLLPQSKGERGMAWGYRVKVASWRAGEFQAAFFIANLNAYS